MLIEFFLKLKEGGVPVSIRAFLTLIEALTWGQSAGKSAGRLSRAATGAARYQA